MNEDLRAHYSNQVTMCAELESSSGPAPTNLHVSAPHTSSPEYVFNKIA